MMLNNAVLIPMPRESTLTVMRKNLGFRAVIRVACENSRINLETVISIPLRIGSNVRLMKRSS